MSDKDPQLYHITDHAREEALRRNISLDVLDRVINAPDQIMAAHSGRKVYQSQINFDGKLYLVRAIIEETKPLTVITVYRTSNIKKYWSDES